MYSRALGRNALRRVANVAMPKATVLAGRTAAPVTSMKVAGSRGFCEAAPFRPEPHSAKNLMDIGTRRIFSEEHDMFREAVRKFFQTEVVPFHEQWEKDGQVSRECWLKAGELGILGVMAPEEFGAAGSDILSAAIVWEEQSYSGCSGPGFALHSEIVIPYFYNYGTPEQKAKYLPKLISGEWIGAIAMTEPGAGSDLAGVRTTAVREGDHYVLNGSKTFITNGAMADVIITVVKTDTAKGPHGVSLMIVEAGTEGFTKGRKLNKLGMKAQDTSELFYDNCKIPVENCLGGENKGFYHLMNELPQERLLIADMAVASAEAVFEWTRTYIKERKVFGGTVADLQVTKHKMAELKTELAVGRSFMDNCLVLHKEGKLDSSTASMAKYWGTDMEQRVVDACLQLHGGYGFMWDYPVCKVYADARVQRIYGGTNEIMKELIARFI
jgi:long-chain-acyl-CoA dehydrogenase